ncbi:hypothetical protein BH10BAC5_BH10BAC5_24590 [soil metagenome]
MHKQYSKIESISSIESVFKKGSSLPVSITTSDQNKYFVKLKGTGEGTIALISDFISTKLGIFLGLPVLDPTLINLTSNVKILLKDEELYELIKASYGKNLAFKLLKDTNEYSDKYYGKLLENSVKDLIFLFDCFLLNIDRTAINHDVVVSQNRAYVLDFGASFLYREIINKIGYSKSPQIAGQLKRNIFYREGIDPNIFGKKLSLISKENIDFIIKEIPDEWLNYLNVDIGNDEIRTKLTDRIILKINDADYLPDLLMLISKTEVESDKERNERLIKNRKNFENMYLKKNK